MFLEMDCDQLRKVWTWGAVLPTTGHVLIWAVGMGGAAHLGHQWRRVLGAPESPLSCRLIPHKAS